MKNNRSPTLRLAVWNVERPTSPTGYGRKVAMQKAFMGKRSEGDGEHVWVLTETRSDHPPGPDFKGVCAPGGRPYHDPLETIAAVWSRTPIRVLSTPAPVSRGSVVASVEIPGLGVVHIYGSVIAYHGDRTHLDGRVAAKNWEVHLSEVKRQTSEWAQLRRDHPKVPLIVAGDLNMTLSEPQIYGTEEGRELLKEGLAAARLRCLTLEARDPDYPERPLIDHVIASEELELVGEVEGFSRVRDGVRMSDHPGVVVELQLC